MYATNVELPGRQSLALADIGGTALAVTRGTLWVTQENDAQDVVLRPGDVWMVERDGLTVIEAQNDASFRALGRAFERARGTAPGVHPWTQFAGWLLRSAPRQQPYY
ncbi:MAG: DUF2917 domain-containing protein [Proteobacteria bacterium]|nr:DUF2917 domain-containing protein [Pseudomonadota bacterium]